MKLHREFWQRSLGRLTLLIIAWCLWTHCQADERLWVKVAINGKPAQLAFDTGASHSLLLPKSAERLGLAFTNPPTDLHLDVGESPMGRTEEFDLVLGDKQIKTFFGVIEVPTMLAWDVDGVLGWGPLSHNIIMINARLGMVSPLNDVPEETASWTKFKLRTNSALLQLEVPRQGAKPSVILVDTGSSNGVKLPAAKWRAWKANHRTAPTTLDAYYAPATGLVVAEEAWAGELALGPLLLSNVPVTEASKIEATVGSKDYKEGGPAESLDYEASLGLAALKRLEVVIDGKEGVAYLLPKKNLPPAYEHNRLGAVFTPVDMQANDLIARVADRTPAYEAGIRNGDILLKIGELDATKWRTDPAVMPLTQFWTRPPGTKLELSMKRGNDVWKTNVVLRQILSAETNIKGQP